MGVASGVDAFDGRSISETPVRDSVAKGANAPAPARESAVGKPSLANFDSAAATGATTIQAADSRAQTSPLRATSASVDHFEDADV